MTDINLLGRTLGPFEIISELGRGGMAVVYKARQADLDRTLEAFGGASRFLRLVHSNLSQDQAAHLEATFTVR